MIVAIEDGSPVVPGEPAGRPRVWQAALIAVAFGIVAAGSCAEFERRFMRPSRDPEGIANFFAVLFFASLVPTSCALLLTVFRVSRRRQREAWPSSRLTLPLSLSGTLIAAGGFLGTTMIVFGEPTLHVPARVRGPLALAGCAVFLVGLVIALGAAGLSVVGEHYRTVERSRER